MLRPRCLSGNWIAVVILVMATACSRSGTDAAPSATTGPSTTPPTAVVPSTVVPLPGPPRVGVTACRPTPPPGAAPLAWLPPDLPLPAGAYAVEDSTSAANPGLSSGLLVVPGSLHDWVRFTNAEWHKAGWIQGRGEAEAGEAENTYVRGREGGAWRVRSAFCDERFSELLLIYKK